jgi:cytochrome P450
VVRFRLGPHVVHLVNHPDHAEHVLRKHAANYDKRTRSTRFSRMVTGESVLTGDGELWKRRRRMLQPAFHHQNLAALTDRMTASTAEMLEAWRGLATTGRPFDVASEMMRLTYVIVGRTLFSAEVGADAGEIERALRVLLPQAFVRLGRIFNPPGWFPTPDNVRFRAALRSIDRVVYRLIARHRRNQAAGEPDLDLLALLMAMRDEETGAGLSDRELRNEAVTFLLAGHETTANALTWTFHLLSRHPDVENRLREELAGVLAGRAPTLDDLSRLPYLKQVIQESMRLYPPVWIIERRVIAEDTVGGFRLPAGSAVVIAPYALHRHPEFWVRPEAFEPSRFETSASDAYIPFGMGSRSCIGNEFAMLEARLITAMIVQAFRLRWVPGRPVEPQPGLTLRSRNGLMMTAHKA